MKPQRDGLPLAAPMDRTTSYQRVPCGCGGSIEASTLPLWRQRYGGEVEFKCDRCGRLETAADRVAAGPVRRKHAQPAREVAPPEPRICAHAPCGKTFTPRKRSEARTFCSVACANKARHPDGVVTPPVVIGETRSCACGCGATFPVERTSGKPRRFLNDTCRVRARNRLIDANATQRAERRAQALESLRAFYLAHGRAPTRDELGLKDSEARDWSVPNGSSLKHFFGSVARAFELAGIPSRGAGEHVARRKEAA